MSASSGLSKITFSLTRQRIMLSGLLLACFVLAGQTSTEFSFKSLAYFLLGITGAIFANSTGAGGGVVFIPVFEYLDFSENQSVSTSFAIQCFGMTAGAFTWCFYYFNNNVLSKNSWQNFLPIVVLCSAFSVMGLWFTYIQGLSAPATLGHLFSAFSIILGLGILISITLVKPRILRDTPSILDWTALIVITFCGGMITAWLSVGVGEIIAFYLIFRRFDAVMAIAIAVVVSAITVWSASPYHLFEGSAANWQVIALAGPGAIIGGIAARSLVGRLSPRRLKIFFGVWLLIIGVAS